MAVSMPEILARAPDYTDGGFDARYRSQLPALAVREWSQTPISARLLAFRDQTTDAVALRSGIPCPGANRRGGWLLTPAAVDGAKLITGQDQVIEGEASILAGTNAYFGLGNPNEKGQVVDGWKIRRETTTGDYVTEQTDTDGEDDWEAIRMNCAARRIELGGNIIVTEGEVLHPPWFFVSS